MSSQLIELVIFAAIAFFIINKLISTLGTTSDDDPARNKTFFGEGTSLKDVTGSAKNKQNIIRPKFSKDKKMNLRGLIVSENKEEIKKGISEVLSRTSSFNIEKFLQGSKAAFKMIVNYGADNSDELEELVDPRYVEHFKSIALSYGECKIESKALKAQVSEIYMFGNNIFVKVLFIGKNITNKIQNLHEEWTFTKSVLNKSPNWHLTNIDRPQ